MSWGTWTIVRLLECGPVRLSAQDGSAVVAGVAAALAQVWAAVHDARVADGETADPTADRYRQRLDVIIGVGLTALQLVGHGLGAASSLKIL